MTELETVMMDWLAKAINLPEYFIHGGKGPGGGVIQGELAGYWVEINAQLSFVIELVLKFYD